MLKDFVSWLQRRCWVILKPKQEKKDICFLNQEEMEINDEDDFGRYLRIDLGGFQNPSVGS